MTVGSRRAQKPRYLWRCHGHRAHNPLSPEQFTAAYQANLETLFALSQTAFSSVEKIVALNLNVAKANLQESQDKALTAMSVKDPQDLLSWNAQQLQPAAEKAVAYSR